LLPEKWELFVFVLELHASDVHAVLGRLLDQIRVAGLKLAAVSAWAEAGAYRIRASVDADDRETVDRLARRIGMMICVAGIEVRRDTHAAQACTAPAPLAVAS
jgi:hypothetical protein